VTDRAGAHVTVDALGSGEIGREAIGLLRPRGRHVQVGLLLGKEADPKVPMGTVIANELRIIGSHGMSAARYPEMLGMVADGRLRPGELVGKRIGLEGIPAAMEEMGTFGGGAGMMVAVL
jgi:threonine dehydrogenase-like Zn-dependent dehydrogenase